MSCIPKSACLTELLHACRRPMWKRVFRWERGVLLVALLAIAVATNPDEQHFVKFVQEYTQRGLGFLPGPLLRALTIPVKSRNPAQRPTNPHT